MLNRVQAIRCRFAAMVGLPSRLTVRAWRPTDDRRIGFVVEGPTGELVVRDGWPIWMSGHPDQGPAIGSAPC